jgi:hypothetical protein
MPRSLPYSTLTEAWGRGELLSGQFPASLDGGKRSRRLLDRHFRYAFVHLQRTKRPFVTIQRSRRPQTLVS